jgi:hypothetical protein
MLAHITARYKGSMLPKPSHKCWLTLQPGPRAACTSGALPTVLATVEAIVVNNFDACVALWRTASRRAPFVSAPEVGPSILFVVIGLGTLGAWPTDLGVALGKMAVDERGKASLSFRLGVFSSSCTCHQGDHQTHCASDLRRGKQQR